MTQNKKDLIHTAIVFLSMILIIEGFTLFPKTLIILMFIIMLPISFWTLYQGISFNSAVKDYWKISAGVKDNDTK